MLVDERLNKAKNWKELKRSLVEEWKAQMPTGVFHVENL